MPTKRSVSKMSRLNIVSTAASNSRRGRSQGIGLTGNGKQRSTAPSKSTGILNEYLCAIERNQNGKYTVRVRVVFSPHADSWALPVYFLASSFNAGMKKLEESLQLLQKNEEKLRFWGVDRTDDPNLTGDLLQEFGLWLDRRREFPRKVAELSVPRERPVTGSMLAPVRRLFADSLAQERPAGIRDRAALASD